MRQRLKGFLILISISFLLAYVASEYYARKVDAEVEISSQRLNVLYNTHEVSYHIIAIQEGLYSLLSGTIKDPDFVSENLPDLEEGVKALSISISYIYYAGRDDAQFRTYSHHVEVIDALYPKFIDKIKIAVEAKEKRERERYLQEAIETGEGLEVIVRELDKFLEQEYKKINGSFSIVPQRMRWIRNVTGGLFFLAIVILSYLMFSSYVSFKKTLRPFLEAVKAGDYAAASRMKGEDDGCSNEIICAFKTIIDKITEDEKTSESLTITDSLTGAYNRRYLDLRLAEEMNRSIRYGTIFSISLIDIDHFKEVNDTFGHQIGDSVLKEIVMLMRDNSRETDIVARYGGEEFLIIYPCTPKSGVLTQVERLREVVERYKFKELERPVTISIGVSDSAGKMTAKQVVQEADSNLYLAKNRGRNRCVITGVTA